MSEKQYLEPGEQLSPDPQKLVVQLYRDYAFGISKNLWPWEKARWYELVFCILTTIGEPQVLAGTARRLTNTMSELELLDLGELAKLNPPDDAVEAVKSKLVTIDTLLQQVGFTPEKSRSAVTAICEAASSIQEKFLTFFIIIQNSIHFSMREKNPSSEHKMILSCIFFNFFK